MSVLSDIYQALKSSAELTEQLANGAKSIYHLHSPDAGTYPILQYKTISDVPALYADDEEKEKYVTIQIHIMTKDGRYANIYVAVQKIMNALGFVRIHTTELYDKGLKIKVVDYKIGVDS